MLYSVHTYNIGSLFYLTRSICHLLQVLQTEREREYVRVCVCVCACACVCVCAVGTVTSYDLYDT
jgi:hypothetical protein